MKLGGLYQARRNIWLRSQPWFMSDDRPRWIMAGEVVLVVAEVAPPVEVGIGWAFVVAGDSVCWVMLIDDRFELLS